MVYAPEPDDEDLVSAMNDILLPEAEEHGVGLVLTADPASYDSWDNRATAERVQPGLWKMEEFITAVIPNNRHDEIRGWFG